MPRPRIAVLPDTTRTFVRDAVVAGGADIVALDDAEGLVWTHHADPGGLRIALEGTGKDVRWVQLPWAGVEVYAEAGLFGDGRTWTCGKGVYAAEVAEHALGLALAGLRDLPDRVRARSWARPSGRSLVGGRAVIVGGGGITDCLLRLLEPFGAEVTVVRRHADRPMSGAVVVGADDLLEVLPAADVVFLALSLTPETRQVIGREALAAMAPHAWLVNVARGAHVDTDALVDALREGSIGGAALDVTDPEPLPDGHPLWDLPNVIITPHCANTPEMAVRPLSRRITENVRRFATGEPLIGLVDPALGY